MQAKPSVFKKKLTRCPGRLLDFKKNPQIFIKLNHNPFHSLFLHEQYYTYNLNTKTRQNKKLFNIKFDKNVETTTLLENKF